MIPSADREILNDTDPGKHQHGEPGVGSVAQELASAAQTEPRNFPGTDAPDAGATELLIGGAGI